MKLSHVKLNQVPWVRPLRAHHSKSRNRTWNTLVDCKNCANYAPATIILVLLDIVGLFKAPNI